MLIVLVHVLVVILIIVYLNKLNIIKNLFNIHTVQCINMTLPIIGFIVITSSLLYVTYFIVTDKTSNPYDND